MSIPKMKVSECFKNLKNLQYTYRISTADMSDALNILAQNISLVPKKVESALKWIVNYEFEIMMKSILPNDASLLNRLFAPSNIETHDSPVISKLVLDNIARKITRRTEKELDDDLLQYDAYSIAAMYMLRSICCEGSLQ
jgi:hypothetical protein